MQPSTWTIRIAHEYPPAAHMEDLELIYKKVWDHYNQITNFTKAEFDQIVELSTIVTLKKGELVFKQGTIPKYGGYIIRGAVRYFHTDNDRREITTGFQFEDDCFGDMRSILFNEPASLSLQAIEETTIGRLDKSHYLHLFDHCKPFAKVMLLALEKNYNQLVGETIQRIDREAQERYVKMMSQYPHILQRVPQRHIASYLGIKPQSLSRIRKSITERPTTAMQYSVQLRH